MIIVLDWQIVRHLQHVNFTLQSGERVYFDENGDPSATYELVNWQRNQAGDTVFVVVGSYDASLPNGRQITMNGINITWVTESQMVRPLVILWHYYYKKEINIQNYFRRCEDFEIHLSTLY